MAQCSNFCKQANSAPQKLAKHKRRAGKRRRKGAGKPCRENGRMVDPTPLRCEIFEMMREYVGANLAKKVTNVVDVLKLAAQVEDGHEGLHLLMVAPHIPAGAKLY